MCMCVCHGQNMVHDMLYGHLLHHGNPCSGYLSPKLKDLNDGLMPMRVYNPCYEFAGSSKTKVNPC